MRLHCPEMEQREHLRTGHFRASQILHILAERTFILLNELLLLLLLFSKLGGIPSAAAPPPTGAAFSSSSPVANRFVSFRSVRDRRRNWNVFFCTARHGIGTVIMATGR